MPRIFVYSLLAIIFISCNRQQKTIEFPGRESEFSAPLVKPFKMPRPAKAMWVTLTGKIKKPRVTKINFAPGTGPVFDTKHDHPLAMAADSLLLPLDKLPSVPFDLQKLPCRKIKPKIILAGIPAKVKAGFPLPESQFVYGLMEMGQDQGLPGTSVQSMTQDKSGRLWLATDNGLCFFDGEFIYTYTIRQGISRDDKLSLCTDSNGHIWAAGAGVDEIIPDEGIIRHYGKNEGLATSAIATVHLGSNGKIYFGGPEGVDIYDTKTSSVVHIGKKEGLSVGITINNITEGPDGCIWVASNCGGVNILSPGAGKMYYLKQEQGLSNNDTRAIRCDHKGNIWMGGWNGGVDMYDTRKKILYQLRTKHGLAFNYIHDLMEDHLGNIWIGYTDGGADRYNPEKRELFHVYGEIGTTKSCVFSLLEDKRNCIWLGCNIVGTEHFDPSNGLLANYNNKYWLAHCPVMALNEDTRNDLWISTSGQGLSVFHSKQAIAEHMMSSPDWTDAYQNFTLDDAHGRIYMGTDYRFNIWDRATGNLTSWGGEEGFPHYRIKCAGLFKKGVLLGTNSGLVHYDTLNSAFEDLKAPDDSIKYSIECMTKDSYGNFWIGTRGGGVYLYDTSNSTLCHFGAEQGFPDTKVTSLLADHNGHIWVGTVSQGLKKIDPDNKTVTCITTDNGLADMTVANLVEKDNIVYAGTNTGLSIISNNGGNLNIRNMGKAQGFRAIDFNSAGAILSHDGSLWWSVGDLLSNYIPAPLNQKAGSAIITGIDIMGVEQLFADKKKIQQRFAEKDTLWEANKVVFYTDNKPAPDTGYLYNKGITWQATTGPCQVPVELKLPYNQDHLTFHFTGNFISNADKTRYRYILEGIDTRWNSATNSAFADYRNIPPGTYTFKVCSSNYGGPWSNPAEFMFTITPPWWKTGLAYGLYIALIIGAAFGYTRIRTASLRARQKELELLVVKRTRQIVSQKNEIEAKKIMVEEKQKEILDSITYAKRLQDAILPSAATIKEYLPDSFVFYKPKDIVAGDFYWMERAGDNILIAAADCTGHGVPGAMVSVVCSNALNRTVKEFKITEPGKILDKVRELVLETFEKSEDNVQDGMDISLCCINTKTKEIQWSGAYNSLWYIHNGEMKELPADKQPIGKTDNPKPFTTHTLSLSGSSLYLFTDGFADQFGGPKGKKFKYKQLQEKLSVISSQPMEEQKKILEQTLQDWKGNLEQVDDILIIGIKV